MMANKYYVNYALKTERQRQAERQKALFGVL